MIKIETLAVIFSIMGIATGVATGNYMAAGWALVAAYWAHKSIS